MKWPFLRRLLPAERAAPTAGEDASRAARGELREAVWRSSRRASAAVVELDGLLQDIESGAIGGPGNPLSARLRAVEPRRTSDTPSTPRPREERP